MDGQRFELEDVMKVETGFGKGILSSILKKILERKFGVKFESFEVPTLFIQSGSCDKDINFVIEICGQLPKCELINLWKKGEKE